MIPSTPELMDSLLENIRSNDEFAVRQVTHKKIKKLRTDCIQLIRNQKEGIITQQDAYTWINHAGQFHDYRDLHIYWKIRDSMVEKQKKVKK